MWLAFSLAGAAMWNRSFPEPLQAWLFRPPQAGMASATSTLSPSCVANETQYSPHYATDSVKLSEEIHAAS